MKKPGSMKEALESMKAAPMTSEEAEAMLDDEEDGGSPVDIPDWVTLPPGFKFPAGKVVYFLRFRAAWTDTPGKGDRTCVVWNLNGADEKHALTRTRGDGMKLITELSKQAIRVVDGTKANWTGNGGPGSVDKFYDEIGAKCRQLIQNHYVKTHTLEEKEREDFLEHCIVAMTAG